jgi:hypothetical protein
MNQPGPLSIPCARPAKRRQKCHRGRVQLRHAGARSSRRTHATIAADLAPRTPVRCPQFRLLPGAAARAWPRPAADEETAAARRGRRAAGSRPRLRPALRRRTSAGRALRARAAPPTRADDGRPARRCGPARRSRPGRRSRPARGPWPAGPEPCESGAGSTCRVAEPVRSGTRRDAGRSTAAGPDHAVDHRSGAQAYPAAGCHARSRRPAASTPRRDVPAERWRGRDDRNRGIRAPGPGPRRAPRARHEAHRLRRPTRDAPKMDLHSHRGRLTETGFGPPMMPILNSPKTNFS